MIWCRGMINKLIFLLTLVSFANSSFAEQIKQEASLSLNVNILNPVCKLASGDQTLYFDDFNALDVVTNNNKLIKNAVLNFTECSGVKKLNISFVQSGQTPPIDTVNNWIPNKSGTDMAAGIAIILLNNNNSLINLGQKMVIDVGQSESSKQITLKAQVVPTDKAGSGIKPGKLETAVGIEISYE